MHQSASQLIKRSLAQLVFFEKRKQQPKITKRMKRGNQYAEELVKSQGYVSELRGSIQHKNSIIHFTIDSIDNTKGIEIKMVEEKYEDWYLQSSILQATLYYSLLEKVKFLETPKFRINEGYEYQFYDLEENPIHEFELQFGELIFNIYPSEEVLSHYLNKSELLFILKDESWEDAIYKAKKYDHKYKHKEWSLLKDSIKLNQNILV